MHYDKEHIVSIMVNIFNENSQYDKQNCIQIIDDLSHRGAAEDEMHELLTKLRNGLEDSG